MSEALANPVIIIPKPPTLSTTWTKVPLKCAAWIMTFPPRNRRFWMRDCPPVWPNGWLWENEKLTLGINRPCPPPRSRHKKIEGDGENEGDEIENSHPQTQFPR